MGNFAVMKKSKRANRSRGERLAPWQSRNLDSLPQSKLYTIKEVASIFGVEEHVLRYWEKGTTLSPRRMPSGCRRYSIDDLRLIERIYYLVQVKGMTIQAAATHLEHPDLEVDLEVRDRLLRVRERLLEMRNRVGEAFGLQEEPEQ